MDIMEQLNAFWPIILMVVISTFSYGVRRRNSRKNGRKCWKA